MSNHTQLQPYVLIGSLSERPDAAGVKEGVFFRASDGTLYLLVIDPTTGIHRWAFVANGLVPTTSEPSLMLFAGSVLSQDVIFTTPWFFANQVTGSLFGPTGMGYPVASTGAVITELHVNVRANTLDSPTDLGIYVDGVQVGPMISIPGAFTGVLQIPIPSGIVAPNALVDVGITSLLETSGGISLTATLVLR